MAQPGTVLITGGNGNLGRLAAERFEDMGSRVVSIDIPGSEGPHTKARSAVVTGDIRDRELVASVLETHRPDAVLHLASLLSGSSEADPETAWEVNATASFALMRLASERVPGPFVFASTIATYAGALPSHLPEDAPQWPDTVYGATKVAVERLGVWMKSTRDFDFRCLRIPLVLSPFAPPGAVTAYPSHAVTAAAAGRHFTFPVRPESGMSTLFIDDVVGRPRGPQRLRSAAGFPGIVYNLHGFHAPAEAVAKAIQERLPNSSFDYAPDARLDRMMDAWPDTIDCSAADEDWGLASGIRSRAQRVRNHRAQRVHLTRSRRHRRIAADGEGRSGQPRAAGGPAIGRGTARTSLERSPRQGAAGAGEGTAWRQANVRPLFRSGRSGIIGASPERAFDQPESDASASVPEVRPEAGSGNGPAFRMAT